MSLRKLFDIPQEIGGNCNRNCLSVCSGFIASIGNDKMLQIYSFETKSIVASLSDVSWVIFNDCHSFKSQVAIVQSNNTIKIIALTSEMVSSLPFNESNRIAKFQYTSLSESAGLLCEFTPNAKIQKLFSADSNSFIIADDQNKITKYVLYPDGVYITQNVDSRSCIDFAWNGIYIAGYSSNEVHIWSANMRHLCSISQNTSILMPSSFSEFALSSGNSISIVNSDGKIIKQIDHSSGVEHKFVVLPNQNIFDIPDNYTLINASHFLPLLSDNSTVSTIDDPEYLQRLFGYFPFNIVIPILSSSESESQNASFIVNCAIQMENEQIVENYILSQDSESSLSFLKSFLEQKPNQAFLSKLSPIISKYCINQISKNVLSDQFSVVLAEFRLLLCPITLTAPQPTQQKIPHANLISQGELLETVKEALAANNIISVLPTLQHSFRDFVPFTLFRTIALQYAWMKVCTTQIYEAEKIIKQLGEDPLLHFYEMWRQTTRNGTRDQLYNYLSHHKKLTPEDQKHAEILKKITTRYPNTSFTHAQKKAESPAIKAVADDAKLQPWTAVVDLNADFNENKSMIFKELFRIPDEPLVDSPKYFLGNIALIEDQTPETLKMLTSEGTNVESLWTLHCQHKVSEMANQFKDEIQKAKGTEKIKKLQCIKFMNKYYSQMNTYELETLLDILCQNGLFAKHELDNFEHLLIRICKNKVLFDSNWWTITSIDFADFFKKFASFCASKSLFMPFEMFVISHPKAKEIDIDDIQEPLIRFIWQLWIRRDPASATLSCMQFIAKSNSTDLVELWQHLPNDSLAPLASFVWKKEGQFLPGSRETEALSERLKPEYPLLSSLVKGEIPHPQGPVKEPPESPWRTPIYTSKYDLELHDLIKEHFNYDFSKVFTRYYEKTPGQPPFPHFDHPELITAPSEPPYVHYVKSMLPVSAFQQAIDDGVTEQQFAELSLQCLKEAILEKNIRLAALSFIELADIHFSTDLATDYKLCISLYDKLVLSNDSNTLIEEIEQVFSKKDQLCANSLQRKLSAINTSKTDIELYLLSTMLGVRCNLQLDYTPIINFSKNKKPADLLLFIDRAAELGAHYSISEIVQIVEDEMPGKEDDYNLKEHLVFHLRQSLPTEEGPTSTDIPALVVFRAVGRTDQPQDISLLQEALNRKVQLYALLATSIEGSDLMLCALVTMLTMVDGPTTFDVTKRPPRPQLIEYFLKILLQLLTEKKSLELMQTLELFSENSIAVNLVQFYRSVELFAFRRSEIVLPQINKKLKDNETINDDLMGEIHVSSILNIFHQMINGLIKQCKERSEIHVFRFLQVLDNSLPPPELESRVKLCKVISTFENYRRAIVHCDLLGSPNTIVSELVLNHSLAMGQAAAECLGISADDATKQWLTSQYSTAATPAQVLEIHNEIVSTIQSADAMFFVSLFASLLPYAQPTFVMPIIEYARSLFKEANGLTKYIDALLLHLNICKDNIIEVPQGSGQPSDQSPPLSEILKILFPSEDLSSNSKDIALDIASPVLYKLDTLQRFFETSIDKAIDICLDKRKVSDAHLLCEWRNRDPHNIQLLETVQMALAGEQLSPENEQLIAQFGNKSNMEALLESIARQNGWRFVLISLHYKAALRLDLPTSNILHRKTSEFIESPLSVTYDQWPLVQDLIQTSKMTTSEVASCLAISYANHISRIVDGTAAPIDSLAIDDYTDKFMEFTKLCESPTAVGERLFETAKQFQKDKPLSVVVNLLLHSALCTSDIDECAELLDTMLDKLTTENQLELIIDIVTVFPDPALLPRFFQYLIAQQKLDALPHSKLNEKVGRVIMNCARHVHPFEPQRYFDLTLKYNLFRDHAELQMECGNRLLQGNPDKLKLQDASRNFLLALAYFLREKCYSLSMECLKKLSLISLQLEINEPKILHLEKSQVLRLMCEKDFPFALTIAVAYDMDTEPNWAEAIYEQSVVKKNDDFLNAFQYFRPITSNLCDGVVKKYNQKNDESQRERMKIFLDNIPNLVERYRIAKDLKFQDKMENMKEMHPVVCEWCERVLMANK